MEIKKWLWTSVDCTDPDFTLPNPCWGDSDWVHAYTIVNAGLVLSYVPVLTMISVKFSRVFILIVYPWCSIDTDPLMANDRQRTTVLAQRITAKLLSSRKVNLHLQEAPQLLGQPSAKTQPGRNWQKHNFASLNIKTLVRVCNTFREAGECCIMLVPVSKGVM